MSRFLCYFKKKKDILNNRIDSSYTLSVINYNINRQNVIVHC